MTNPFGRVALGVVAAALAATSLSASPQDQNTNQPPPPFMGPGGGPGRFPQGGWFGGAMGPGGPLGMLRMFSQQLQLTDAQRDQLKTIAQSHHDEWQALADRARAAHQALAAAVTADTIDETTIRARSADVAAVEADMAVAGAHAYSEVLQILTADQKAKLKALQAQVSARRSSPRGRQ